MYWSDAARKTAAVAGLSAAALAASTVTAVPAHAMGSCSGSFAAGLLQPVPPRTVVGLDIFDNSDRNIELGRRFMAGVAGAGVATSGTPTALLRLTVQFSRNGGSDTDGGSGSPPPFGNFAFGNVGNMPSVPDLDSGSLTPTPRGGGQNSLFMRAQLVDPTSQTVLWVASVTCVLQTTDDGALAYDLGGLIGRSLGKRVDRGPV